jgi:hypothetical protein
VIISLSVSLARGLSLSSESSHLSATAACICVHKGVAVPPVDCECIVALCARCCTLIIHVALLVAKHIWWHTQRL